MRNASRVERDLATLNVVPTHEITIHVVEQLVRIHIAVVIRRGNRIGMVIIQAGDEGTDHKIVAFKLLVNGRRHVDASRQGLKVENGDGVWIIKAIPAYYIKRM